MLGGHGGYLEGTVVADDMQISYIKMRTALGSPLAGTVNCVHMVKRGQFVTLINTLLLKSDFLYLCTFMREMR